MNAKDREIYRKAVVMFVLMFIVVAIYSGLVVILDRMGFDWEFIKTVVTYYFAGIGGIALGCFMLYIVGLILKD